MTRQGPAYWALMALFVGFCLAPFLWLVLTSLSPDADIASLPPLLPSRLVFDHYPAVFTERPFARFLLNSLAVASATTAFCLAVAVPLSYSSTLRMLIGAAACSRGLASSDLVGPPWVCRPSAASETAC